MVNNTNKYFRLIRNEFTQDQIDRFINRQLVETRQITKHVANIIEGCYLHTRVFTIQANLTHELEKNMVFIKIEI